MCVNLHLGIQACHFFGVYPRNPEIYGRGAHFGKLVAKALASTPHTMISPQPFNFDKKFVRIIQTHATGLVAFEFAMGEPELFVELLMSQAAFDEFCVSHGVTPTQGHLAQAPNTDTQEWDWSLRAAREQQIRHGNKG